MTNFLCNARLDDIYFENEEYVRADAKVDEILAKIAKGEITKVDEVMMNEYIDSYVYLMTLQTQMAYKQGMKDLAAFTATLFDVIVNDIRNFVFGLAKAHIYGFGNAGNRNLLCRLL